jgi:adrenodoxin-NADP+ reductase
MINAYAAADTVLDDILPDNEREEPKNLLEDCVLNPSPELDSIPKEVGNGIRGGLITSYDDWKKIDAEEIRRGREIWKERERMGWEEAKMFLHAVKQ